MGASDEIARVYDRRMLSLAHVSLLEVNLFCSVKMFNEEFLYRWNPTLQSYDVFNLTYLKTALIDLELC